MVRKVLFVLIIFSFLSTASAGQVLNLKGRVPATFEVSSLTRPDGFIQPVIRSNVVKNSNQFKIKSSRSPASVNGIRHLIIEAN